MSGIYGAGSDYDNFKRVEADRLTQGNAVPIAKSRATEPAAFFADIAPDVKALTWGGEFSAGAGGLNASNRDRPYFNGLTSTVHNSR